MTIPRIRRNRPRTARRNGFPLALGLLIVALSGNIGFADDAPDADRLLKEARARFRSITADAAGQAEKAKSPVVELGRKLFFDPRVSADGVWSCMLCHQPTLYGTDAQAVSRGVFDKPLPRNAPTVLNTTLQFRQHWDGVFATAEEQATHALLGPGFGNPDNATAMERLKAIPGYPELFATAFPADKDPVTAANWGTAIGAYERTLLTPSRFDAFLDGDQKALTPAEQAGLGKFLSIGCADCHNLAGVGGNSYEKFGIESDYWKATHSREPDVGRFKLTKSDEDKYVFKVAPLRNVAMTPPYFHDGSVDSLPEAVKVMASVQLGDDLSDSDVESITAFLKTLTGDLPAGFAQSPVLPAGKFHTIP